jgi:hypothetical protein
VACLDARIRMMTSAREADASTILAVAPPPAVAAAGIATELCDYCGSARLAWRKCKLICDDCRQINKSCADL